MKSRVAIHHHRDVSRALAGALDLLDGLDGLFNGKHVAVKPNDTWASPEDVTPCTQADTLRAALSYVKRSRPERVTVTGGAGAAETDDVFRILGLDRVIEEEGAEFFDHNRAPFTAVDLFHGPHGKVMVNPHVFEYDTLVSLAQLKVHHLAGVTLSMKNIAMSYPAADYYGHARSERLHPHRFFSDIHGLIAGMCQRFPIQLAIITGHPAMTGKGPIGGKTFETGLVIASRDFVAADLVGSRLLGQKKVKHIQQAGELGLGAASMDEVEFPGIGLEEAGKLFRESKGRG